MQTYNSPIYPCTFNKATILIFRNGLYYVPPKGYLSLKSFVIIEAISNLFHYHVLYNGIKV